MKISPHFSREELTCRCGCGAMQIPAAFLAKLEDLRQAYNHPLRISSGYRCPAYNQRISSTGLNGPHTIAAVDIAVAGLDAYDLVHLALMIGFSGIGIHQRGPYSGRFIHLDDLPIAVNPRPRIWSY